MGLLGYMSAQRPPQARIGLLAALSNQGKLIQPQQQMMPDAGAAQAMQGFLQAQAQARQPIQKSKDNKGGGFGNLMSIFKTFMG